MDDLNALEEWAGALLARMEPAARRKVAVDVGRELRRSQQQRIKQQQNPDGSAFEPRKPRMVMRDARLREKEGRIKRRFMFAKLRTAKFLKVTVDRDGLAIGFTGRAARLARVHQEGQTASVDRNGATYTYPIRQVLGFTQAEREMIHAKLLEHLAP